MTEKLTMFKLYQKLEKVGFSKKFINSIGLPSWWVEELNESTNLSIICEGAGHISSRLFLDLKSILNANQEVKFVYDMTYEKVILTLKTQKRHIQKHPLDATEIEDISDDRIDYLEQLLTLEF